MLLLCTVYMLQFVEHLLFLVTCTVITVAHQITMSLKTQCHVTETHKLEKTHTYTTPYHHAVLLMSLLLVGLLKSLHKVGQCLYTLLRHCIVYRSTHPTHTAMTLELDLCRGEGLECMW